MKEPNIIVTQEILRLIAEIDEFKGRWQDLKTLSPERLRALRKIATLESVGSSTRIEGVKLTDRQIETLLSSLDKTAFATRDEQEVVDYAEVMDIVFAAWEDLRITENYIKQLHSILLKHSTKDERHRGDYKKLPNHVAAYDEDGKEIGIVFETASPFDTPQQMEELVRWLNKAVSEESLHPLLIIAVFIVVFLAIHPFQDGNGRLSRILTTLLLLRAGYVYVPYASLESVVEENKDLYYKALRRTQAGLKSDTPDWDAWTVFFLRCLKKQKSNLAAKIEYERQLATRLPELSVKILELIQLRGRTTLSDIEEATGANKNTIKVRLRELVQEGHIVKHGQARSTWYARN